MASYTVKGSKNNHTWTITTTENSTSIGNNTSSMTISLKLGKTSYTFASWGSKLQYRLRVYKQGDSGTCWYNTGWRNAPDHYPNSDSNLTWISGDTFTVGHEANGTRTITVYFEFTDSANKTYTPGNASGGQDIGLTTIPRYFTSTPTITFSSKTETTAVYTWRTSETCSSISWNGGGSASISGIPGTSGTISVSGLNANTGYTHSGTFKRSDSGLTTNSGSIYTATYNYPYITGISTSPLNIGSQQTVSLYNPLGRGVTVYMKQNSTSGTQLHSVGTSSTSVSFTPDANTLYSSIPNSTSGTACYYCAYGSTVLATKSGTYVTSSSSCVPTFSTSTPISYTDTNSTTKTLMGDNGVSIVQNKSNLSVTISAATAKNGASISKYIITLDNITKTVSSSGTVSFGNVNFSSNRNLVLYAVDSRGYQSQSYSKAVTIVPWSAPSITVNRLQRLNNYEETTYLKVTRNSYSSLGGKNAAKLGLSYSCSATGESTVSGTLTSGTETSFKLVQNKAYTVTITSSDALSTNIYTYTVGVGTPLMDVNATKLGIGINCAVTANGLSIGDCIRIPQNGSNNYGLCNMSGTSIIRDHNNGNVTVDATGGVLYLGWQNTTSLDILNGKATINSSGIYSGGAVKDGNGSTISSTYLKLSGGTLTGDVAFTATGTTGASNGISWSGSTDNAKIYYNAVASDQGLLYIQSGDDTNAGTRFYNTSSKKYVDITNGAIYKQGANVPCVFIQSSEPTATQTGDIWFS